MHKKKIRSYYQSIAILLSILLTPALSCAAGVNVQAGAGITFSGGSINLGCTDLLVSGDFNLGNGAVTQAADISISGGMLDAGSGQISLAGDWSNSGAFIASSSQVNIVDGCSKSTSIVSGDNVYHSFSVNSSSGKELQIEAGSQQTFLGSLGLQGAEGMLLLIRSTAPGSYALFNLKSSATQVVSYVDVRDNNALAGTLIAPGAPESFNSINSGNNLVYPFRFQH